jgi:hypothetical protein
VAGRRSRRLHKEIYPKVMLVSTTQYDHVERLRGCRPWEPTSFCIGQRGRTDGRRNEAVDGLRHGATNAVTIWIPGGGQQCMMTKRSPGYMRTSEPRKPSCSEFAPTLSQSLDTEFLQI